MERFPYPSKIECAQALFGNILDLENFHVLLSSMPPPLRPQLILRLGWLNIWNPANPDGQYVLDMSKWDERRMAEMLIHLSCLESGRHLFDCSYQPKGAPPPKGRPPEYRINERWIGGEAPENGTFRVTYATEGTNGGFPERPIHWVARPGPPDGEERHDLQKRVLMGTHGFRVGHDHSWVTSGSVPRDDSSVSSLTSLDTL